jgi:hypothetical protein
MYLEGFVQAGSILSSKGLGIPYGHPNTRNLGMGSIAIAVLGPASIPRLNPACLYTCEVTQFSVQYFYERNRYNDDTGEVITDYSNFDGFSFIVPLGHGFGVSTGMSPLTRLDYKLAFQNTLDGESYTKSVEGLGGLNDFSFSMYWAPIQQLSIGLTGRFIFGNIKETWRVDYDGSNFISTNDVFTTKNNGFSWTGGLILRPINNVVLGCVYSPNISISNTTETTYTYLPKDTLISYDGSLLYPSIWGIGFSYHVGKYSLIGIEYLNQNWSEMKINDEIVPDARNIGRFSFGTEIQLSRTMTDAYLKRISYRLGFSLQPYYVKDPEGNNIYESWMTIGLGLPLIRNMAQIDLALGYGTRGNSETNGFKENLFMVSLGITGGERWFIRRYK